MQTEPINKINIITSRQSIENIELVHSGEDYFLRLLNIITAAKHEIHLQTFTFEDDTTGLEIAKALKKAADRNVKIYILIDGYGSSKLPNAFLEDLGEYGINIRFFSPLFSKNNFYLGRRLHHKVVVVDGEIVLIGVINMANTYHGSNTAQVWLD
jgi:cardiolipin synthase